MNRHKYIFVSILFTAVAIIAFIILMMTYDGEFNYERPYKETRIDDFSSIKLIDQICDTRETVSFVLEDYKFNLPCQAREHFSFGLVENQTVDYAHPDYKSGHSSIPIRGLYFYFKELVLYNWEVPRPAGTYLGLYISPHTKVSHNCKHATPKQIWCDHSLFAHGTDLTIRLTFNAGSMHYGSYRNREISPERYPWAYYPEDKWPELHEQTQKFVDSILE